MEPLLRALRKPDSVGALAKRPSLLLKGTGRVNRILGPEDLTGTLGKSARQARRQGG